MNDIYAEQLKQYTVLWRETSAMYEEWAKKRGLSYSELLVILSLTEPDGPYRQKDICNSWQLPKQTVNTILKNFAGHDWITLAPSDEDRRNKVILLTEDGQCYMGGIAAGLLAHERAVWKKLGQEHGNALIKSTALYNQLFKETDANEDT